MELEISENIADTTDAAAAAGDTNEAVIETSTDAVETAPEQESSENKVEAKQEPPEHFREGYARLEKDVNEKYKPVVSKVDALGGVAVLDAIEPLLKLTMDESIGADEAVATLKQSILPQHLESLAWAALDNPDTQRVILQDPDVLQAISQQLFSGKSIEEVQAALANSVDDDVDPELAAVRKQLSERDARDKAAQEAQESQAANQRVEELQNRFFENTCNEVLKQFNFNAPEGASEADKKAMNDSVIDLKYAAQGRFLSEHAQDYGRIQELHAKGLGTQARIAETRLQNMWQATLIQTAERFSQQVASQSAAKKAEQQAKINGVNPDISGGNVTSSETQKSERYDLNDPNWLQNFMTEFKREAAGR